MSKPKHTPGPWTIHSNGHIRQLDPLGHNFIPRNEADKHLIAAAPEMLEALESVQEIIRESFRDAGGWCGEHRTEWVCPLCGNSYEHGDDCPAHLVDKAIAKAKGEKR